jgi:uncharacterized protein (TIGR03790 family)
MIFLRAALVFLLFLAALPTAQALEPKDVWLLVNQNVPESQQVADHYCQKRGVPKDHIIVLDLPAGEDITRKDYDTKLVAPLRKALKDRKDQVKVLLSIYGVPLRVGREQPSASEEAELAKLHPQFGEVLKATSELQELVATLEAEGAEDPPGILAETLKERYKELQSLRSKITNLDHRRNLLLHAETEACVDSELMLLWWDNYNLRRWQINLLNWQIPQKAREGKPPVLMVSRLDGPSAAIARRLVDDAVEVEKKGLKGKVYVDARGFRFDVAQEPQGTGYGGYDESLREMARLLEKDARMQVTLDDKPALFAPGSCPDCALYCGWYSLGNYVDCCKFVRGAVAYHIASAEAVSLRNPHVKFWCKRMLDEGVAATLGPVREPYTIGFPKPAEFFGFLATGKYTLVECYAKTALLTSWMTVLVGDPLYNPYAKTMPLKLEQVLPSPRGARLPGK